MKKVKCINNSKCENFLDLNKGHTAKQSTMRDDCYTIKVKDKLGRIGEVEADFRKHRFE